jgi:hypothetical protein
MPLLDLSLVTTTLLRLLRERVNIGWTALHAPNPAPPVNYSGATSDKLTGDQALGMFLYHVVEEPHFKNQPPLYQDHPPVRFTPMGLQLHYQLTAHAADQINPENAVIRAQRLFGLALKTWHDYPHVDRDTNVNGLVFPTELQGTDTVFRITLKNVPPNEAANFWTAGTQPVRLAAYYEVSVVLLQPERPEMRAGRVLRYGVQIFVHGAPRLDASQSTVTFRLPNDTADRTVELQPGEAAVGEKISFHGEDLNGDATTLLIKRIGWPEPADAGGQWGIVSGPNAIFAQVSAQVAGHDIVPGVYSAMARVTRNRLMPDGSNRAFPQTSNEVPFTVAPAITNPAYNAVATAVGNIVTIDGGIFSHADVPPENVQVIAGPASVPRQTVGPLTAGHFAIISATQIQFRFPVAGLNSGQVLPLRVIVNGAENAPRWVRVP